MLGELVGCLSAPVLGALAALGSVGATAAALRDIRASRPINSTRVVLIAGAPVFLVAAAPILTLIAQVFRKRPVLDSSNSVLVSDLRIYAAVAVHVGVAGLLGAMGGATLVRRTAGTDVTAARSTDGVDLAIERGRAVGAIVAILFVSIVGLWALAAIDLWFAVACGILAGITGYALGNRIGIWLAKER